MAQMCKIEAVTKRTSRASHISQRTVPVTLFLQSIHLFWLPIVHSPTISYVRVSGMTNSPTSISATARLTISQFCRCMRSFRSLYTVTTTSKLPNMIIWKRGNISIFIYLSRFRSTSSFFLCVRRSNSNPDRQTRMTPKGYFLVRLDLNWWNLMSLFAATAIATNKRGRAWILEE